MGFGVRMNLEIILHFWMMKKWYHRKLEKKGFEHVGFYFFMMKKRGKIFG
jgi:hypothetical protein